MGLQKLREERTLFMAHGNSAMRLIHYPKKNVSPFMQCEDAQYWINDFAHGVERYFMAAKVQPKPVKAVPQFKGFVNYVLNDADKERYKEWDVDDHDLFLLLAGDVSTGYKMSLSYNSQNGTYTATYMCNDDTCPNSGYCLSAFAPDLYHAIRSLCFKHNVILEGVWNAEDVAKKNNWG